MMSNAPRLQYELAYLYLFEDIRFVPELTFVFGGNLLEHLIDVLGGKTISIPAKKQMEKAKLFARIWRQLRKGTSVEEVSSQEGVSLHFVEDAVAKLKIVDEKLKGKLL